MCFSHHHLFIPQTDRMDSETRTRRTALHTPADTTTCHCLSPKLHLLPHTTHQLPLHTHMPGHHPIVISAHLPSHLCADSVDQGLLSSSMARLLAAASNTILHTTSHILSYLPSTYHTYPLNENRQGWRKVEEGSMFITILEWD